MPALSLSTARKRLAASLAVNIAIVVMELVGLVHSFRGYGLSLLQFYTEDSNLLTLIACALLAVYTARYLRDGRALPRWVVVLKYTAVSCLAVTFVVVLTILAPTAGEGGFAKMFLHGSMIYQHLLCPIAALTSFIFLETDPPLTRKDIRFALIPTLLYAAVTISLNILKIMEGPYPFLHVYKQPVYMSVLWTLLILGGAYLLAWLVRRANAACSKRYHRKAANTVS